MDYRNYIIDLVVERYSLSLEEKMYLYTLTTNEILKIYNF